MDDASHQGDAAIRSPALIDAGRDRSRRGDLWAAASVHSCKQGERVVVVDDYGHPGGNHMDWTSPEGYTFDAGSFHFPRRLPVTSTFPELLSYCAD